jgi:hypothetical protein
MKMWKRQALRFSIFAVLFWGCWLVSPVAPTGCAYVQTPQGSALLTTGEGIANAAISAAATAYGGPLAGQLASAGLNALGTVMQGYINKTVPKTIVKESPGVAKVGAAVAPLISGSKPVTQTDVNAVFQAAGIAANK